MIEKRKTYGQIVNEHRAKNITVDDAIPEYRKPWEIEVIDKIHGAIAEAKNQDLYRNHNFYICVCMKTERMGNVPRTWTFARRSCPTPTFQQSVWKYHHKSGSLEFLWSIPDAVRYYHIINNPQFYIADKGYQELAKMVLLMESGELLDWVIKENGEKPDGFVVFKNEPEGIT